MEKELKKTVEQLLEASSLIGVLFGKDEALKKTKFGYAWDMFVKKTFQPTVDIFNEKKAVIEVDCALTDKTTGALLKNEKGEYEYDKDGQKKLMEARAKLLKEWMKEEVVIIPYICKELPKTLVLTEEETAILKGLVI